MKNNRIGFGIFLVIIGIVWILYTFNLLDFSFLRSLTKLWPLIIVVAGINMIFRNNGFVRIFTWIMFFVILIGYGSFFGNKELVNESVGVQNFIEEKKAETKEGDLKVSVGAIVLELDSTNEKLLTVDTMGNDIFSEVDYDEDFKSVEAKIKRNGNSYNFDKKLNENLKIGTNDQVVWDIDISSGASKGTLDMSQLKVRKLELNAGAATFTLLFGDKLNLTEVDLNAGASNLDIEVPKSSGIKIKMEGAFNNFNYGDLNLEKNGKYYISKNYETAINKIDFTVNMGVGNLKLKAN